LQQQKSYLLNFSKMNLTKNKQAFLKLPKPKAVIFDWDNTLVDTWPLIHQAIDTTLIAMGREPWGLEKVCDNVHKSMRESFPIIFGDKWEEAGEIYKNTYRSIHLEKIQLLSNSLKLIETLENKGILQFIVSNKIGATLRKEAKKINVDKKFFALIGATDADADKPSAAPVHLALMGSGVDPQKDEVWFIGDTIADIDCAYNSDCRAILYGHSSGQISKTVAPEILDQKHKKQGLLPVYFDHQHLIDLLNS